MRALPRTPRAVGTVLCAVCFLLFAFLAPPASAQPTVNGLFFGDGDNALYQPYATSTSGSVLYSYYAPATTRLYVALVVDHSVNDNVCSPQNDAAYTQSAGWGNHRNCRRAVDSEFATFSLQCAPGSPNSWTWKQARACEPTPATTPWTSGTACGAAIGGGTAPPGIVTTTSWVQNVNTYLANPFPASAWNLTNNSTDTRDWKSPFVSSSPNDVTQVPGYPTYSGSNYRWEWSSVYEWSVELGPGGANCGDEAIFFLAGTSHHSPGKSGPEDDPFEEPPPDSRFSDWGDNPLSYGTTAADGGASHYITVAGPYLGTDLQAESDGVPTADATGDGAEEDGVTAVVDGNWTAGSTQEFEVVVGNADSGAILAGWFDWNGDGDFDDTGEYFTWPVTTGTNTVSVTVGSGFDWQTDDLYTRFRIFSSGAAAPGGSLTQADSVGNATDGEVEDYFFEIGALPVTLAAMESESSRGGEVTVRWQTASETDNVGFEVWGLVRGEWQALTDLVPSREPTSGLPQSYEASFQAPTGLAALELRDYDSRGRQERFGRFRVDAKYGDFQLREEIDWRGPAEERSRRLRENGFADTSHASTGDGSRTAPRRVGLRHAEAGMSDTAASAPQRWKKVRSGAPLTAGTGHVASAASFGSQALGIASGASTHVAVTDDGVQRVSYETLRDGGLDLAGVRVGDIAVTFRGEPVARWIDGNGKFGPGDALEFVGTAPRGDDALYIDAHLYQVSVDRGAARDAAAPGVGKARRVYTTYPRTVAVDEPVLYRHQSPTGDPWVERSVLVRPGAGSEVTLDLMVDGPVASGTSRLSLGLGTMSDLPGLRDAAGRPLPEHNVEVSFRGPGGSFQPLTAASASGHDDWRIETQVPSDWIGTGLHQVRLRFTTEYFFSLVVVDDYALTVPSPYRGPSLDFPADPRADGYVIAGFSSPDVSAYAAGADGSLTRLAARVSGGGGDYTAELRGADGHLWVTQAPHAPQVFTTEAPSADLLAGPADLVVIAGSSFVGTSALADYLAQHADLDPVVVDVEDVYNAAGYGMALPSAITDYLAARDAVHPFTHVQLVGADCYDRLNRISSCLSFVPLPTAQVGVSFYTPTQNRLVDLDGDGVGDKAVAQFSVRDEAELATIVAKGAAWRSSGLADADAALLIAEESDGVNDFAGQVERLRGHLGWADSDVLDLSDHPSIGTARQAMSDSLAGGRSVTVFSGHSSPTVWSFRGLVTTSTVGSLGNDGRPTLMVPLACETTYDISPNANVLGHRLLYQGGAGAVAVSGAVALSSLQDNELMARHVLSGLDAGLTLGEAVQAGRRALGTDRQELLDNWLTQGDVAVGMEP